MKARHRLRAAWLGGCALLCAGCVTFNGPEKLRLAVTETKGIQLQEDGGLSANTLGLLFSAMFSDIPDVIWHISRLEVGMYQVTETPPNQRQTLLMRRFELPGWTPFIYLRENGEEVRILVKQNDQHIRALSAFMLAGDEFTIVHITGNIDALMASGTDREDFFDGVDRVRSVLERVDRVRVVLRAFGQTQHRHETKLRQALHDSGWSQTDSPAGPEDAEPAEAQPKPQIENQVRNPE